MKCPTCGSDLRQLFTGTFCPNDCDRGAQLMGQILDWGSLSGAEKRVAIALDVLARLEARKFIPKGGYFLKAANFGDPISLDDPNCSACALGGMFMSACGLERKALAIHTYAMISQFETITSELRSVFDWEQLALIECAFERGMGFMRYKASFSETTRQRAIDICPDNATHAERMRAIMENIVRNGGTFVV